MSKKNNSIGYFEAIGETTNENQTRDVFASLPLIRTAYDDYARRVSDATSITFPPPNEEEYSAIQSMRDECDINIIIQRIHTTQFDPFNERVNSGSYLDLAGMPDFQTAMNTINEANSAFADLPAKIRKEFDNDPALFLQFIDNGDVSEFERLGLIPKQPPSSPTESKPPEADASEGSA